LKNVNKLIKSKIKILEKENLDLRNDIRIFNYYDKLRSVDGRVNNFDVTKDEFNEFRNNFSFF
jgi:hypothetical protein